MHQPKAKVVRPLLPIRLRYIRPAGWLRSVRSSLDPIGQGDQPRLKVCLVVPPRQPVHSWRGVALEREERDSEQIDVDMMQERGEPFLFPCLCCLPYVPAPGSRFPFCARRVLCWLAFPLVLTLCSTDSATGRPALFVGFIAIPRLCGNPEKPLANGGWGDSASAMIHPGFLDRESRRDLIELARDEGCAQCLRWRGRGCRADALPLQRASCNFWEKLEKCEMNTAPERRIGRMQPSAIHEVEL